MPLLKVYLLNHFPPCTNFQRTLFLRIFHNKHLSNSYFTFPHNTSLLHNKIFFSFNSSFVLCKCPGGEINIAFWIKIVYQPAVAFCQRTVDKIKKQHTKAIFTAKKTKGTFPCLESGILNYFSRAALNLFIASTMLAFVVAAFIRT